MRLDRVPGRPVGRLYDHVLVVACSRATHFLTGRAESPTALEYMVALAAPRGRSTRRGSGDSSNASARRPDTLMARLWPSSQELLR